MAGSVPLRAATGRAAAATARAAAAVAERRALVLAAFVILQWVGMLLVARGAAHAGWLYYHGGDGTWYWTGAWSLGHLELPYTAIGYFMPALWSPFGAIGGPSMLDGLPYVLVVDVVVLAPLALLLVYGIAERIAGRLFGLFAAFAWLAAPYIGYRMARPDYRVHLLNEFLPGAIGLNMLGDFPSLVACAAAAYLTLRALDSRAVTDAAAAGILAGVAIGIKPANVLFVAAPLAGFLIARRPRQVAWWAIGTLPALLVLAVWKQRGLGELPILHRSLGETRLAAGSGPLAPPLAAGPVHWGAIQTQFAEIREVFWSKTLLQWVAVAGAFGLVRRAPAKGAVVVCWFAAYFLVKAGSASASVYATSFFRLLEPAYPAYVLLAAGTVFLVPGLVRAGPPRARLRPLSRRAAVAIAVVLGLLPLPLVAAATPSTATARGLASNAQVRVVGLGLAARAAGAGRVRLTWSPRPPRRGESGYRVLRALPGYACELASGPVRECYVTATPAANTTGTSFLDRPGPGRWIYRLAVVGSFDRKAADGDPLLVSPPVSVSAR